jgi:hypothetical protein
MKFNDFVNYLHLRYAVSDRFQDRIVYIKLAGAMMAEFDHPTFLRDVWPHIVAYKNEAVTFVRTKVLEFLMVFGVEFRSLENQNISGEMYEIVSKYESSQDVHLKEMWAKVHELILPRRSISSLSGLDKLGSKGGNNGSLDTNRKRAPSMRIGAEQQLTARRTLQSVGVDGMPRSRSLRTNLSRNS